ncbi:MAG: type III-B CRISPR module RAMP protein Cmr4 [Burkholderiaceae bacterium]|nr:type III-B CRISPR module RAMP protein Cmr4 [Burkholderiaceae bacterium]
MSHPQAASALLFLTTETPLHAGAGQSVAGIDLPIQREVHSDWPCVYGSAVKGALRAHAFHKGVQGPTAIDLFGPDHGAAAGERDSSHAGALLVGDATLLALPVRSLQSHFKWVTCPAALDRFARTAERLGLALALPRVAQPGDKLQALGHEDGTLFLEEFRLNQAASVDMATLANALAGLSGGALQASTVQERLVLVHDDIFSFLVRNATSVNAHIAIDAQTKTVKDGALWYEESLPPETLLYVPLTATAARRKGSELKAAQVLEAFESFLGEGANWLQLGGNETTGMGWCRVGVNKAKV